MEERETQSQSSSSSATGGHTYLPGTASLVQEIDSELGAVQYVRAGATLPLETWLCSPILFSVCRATAGRVERWKDSHRISP